MRASTIASAACALLALAPTDTSSADRSGTIRVVATVYLDSGGVSLAGVQVRAVARFGAANYDRTAAVTATPAGGRVTIDVPYRVVADPAVNTLRVSLTATAPDFRRSAVVNYTLPLPGSGVTTVSIPAAL